MVNMKVLLKTIVVILFPLHLFSQDLTGTWSGSLKTSEKILPYEVVITDSSGKLKGYAYTTFTVKGDEMVAMKSVQVRNDDGKIVIEDEDLMYDNFDDEAPKRFVQTSTMTLKSTGNLMTLDGKFKTKKTKEFRSMGGDISLRKDTIVTKTKLMSKLGEMDLLKSLSFQLPEEKPKEDIAVLNKVVTNAETPQMPEKETAVPIAKAEAPVIKTTVKPIAKTTPTPGKAAIAAVSIPVKKILAVPGKAIAAAKAPVSKPVIPVKPVTVPTAPPVAKKTEAVVAATPFASTVGDRKIETIQTVLFKSDSLLLTLYDNGEVDGDTVSVLLNGKTILSKQGLSTNAITKTIYMTPDLGDSIQMIMYAENLGTIAPNTGLLIVKDGRDRYEIRFAGDLTKNAAIIFKRRKE